MKIGKDMPSSQKSVNSMYLSISSSEIRLLVLRKGKQHDPVSCGIRTYLHGDWTDENALPPYEAISYCWGTEEATCEISVDVLKENDGLIQSPSTPPVKLLVRTNLYNALKRLRSAFEEKWFWIDAICIDQEDQEEKTHQLPKMLEIYNNASNVCIWLGEPSSNESKQSSRGRPPMHPLAFATHIADLSNLDKLLQRPAPDLQVDIANWRDFAYMVQSPWFKRRWVIQEVAAARLATVHYGGRSLIWPGFASAVELFFSHLEKIKHQLGFLNDYKVNTALDGVKLSGADVIVSASNNLLRRGDNGVILDRTFTTEALVSKFRDFAATDPRDVVYALLPLASDGPMSMPGAAQGPHVLMPDYKLPTAQAYAQFVKHCAASTGFLDVICRAWALLPSRPITDDDEMSLPSWTRVVDYSALTGPESSKGGTLSSLVGEPGSRVYNASRGMRARCRFATKRMKRAIMHASATSPSAFCRISLLYAEGIKLCRIQSCSDVIGDSISAAALRMAGWEEGSGSISDRTWRTLVADRDEQGRHPPFWFRSACSYLLKQGRTVSGEELVVSELAGDSVPSTVVEYLRRIREVVRGRTFFVGDKTGRQGPISGLGPSGMKDGDVLCVLYGCSVPVVVRRHGDASGKYYKFIGECYVHGYMDGEALAGLDEEDMLRKTTEIELR
jgi:hypothetical protein